METPETYEEAKARRRQRTIVIVIVVVALCCLCLVLAIALYSWSAIRGGQTQELPTSEFPPIITQAALTAPADAGTDDIQAGDPGAAPTGGLGNDILRNDTWQAVAAAAAGQGCDQPLGADSTIEVLQQPDAAGVWVEQWTVACASGNTYDFEVEYVLDDTGATFNIRSLP